MAAAARNGPLLPHMSFNVRRIPVRWMGYDALSKRIFFSCNERVYHPQNAPMTRRDSSPSLPHHWSILRAIDQLIAREKHIRFLEPSSPINPTCMLPKLELTCGNRGPFLAAAAMVVMRLFSSDRLDNWSQGKQNTKCHPESTVCKRPNI
jgi:hypothetical protein